MPEAEMAIRSWQNLSATASEGWITMSLSNLFNWRCDHNSISFLSWSSRVSYFSLYSLFHTEYEIFEGGNDVCDQS